MPDNAQTLASDIHALLNAALCAKLMATCSDPQAHPLQEATARDLLKALKQSTCRLDSALQHGSPVSPAGRQQLALRQALQAAQSCVARLAGLDIA